jgi:hypothetical protein
MPQMTKRPFMAAVMLADGRSVKHFQGVRQSRHDLAATSPRIVPKRADFSPVTQGISRNILEKPMNHFPRLATNQSGVLGFMSDKWDDFDEQPGAAHPIRNGRIATGSASGGEPAGRAGLRAVARAGRIARRAGLRIAQPDPDIADALPRKAARGPARPKNQLALIVETIFSNPTQG